MPPPCWKMEAHGLCRGEQLFHPLPSFVTSWLLLKRFCRVLDPLPSASSSSCSGLSSSSDWHERLLGQHRPPPRPVISSLTPVG